MQLTDDDIREFQMIWSKEVKEELSLEEARSRANEIIEFYMIMAQYAERQNVQSKSRDTDTPP